MLKSHFNTIGDILISWKTAYLIFKENVFFGCGFGNYMVLFKSFRPESVNTFFVNNIFMQMLAEIGLVGVLSFLVLLFSFYKKLIDRIIEGKDLNFYIYVAISITSFIIINLVDYSFFIPANMLVFFIIFSSMFNIESEQRKKTKIGFYVCLAIYAVVLFSFAKPVIANNYCKKGIGFYVSGYYKVAIEEFAKAIKFDKRNPEYYAQTSRAYFALYDKHRGEDGQVYADNAIKYLQKAIELNKYSAQFRSSLALVYWNNDNKEEALKTIQEAIKYDKYNPYYEEEFYRIKNS
jgi:tetratricopeptide (TPR) repeat protein